jgi:hypothetical protein
MCQVTTPGLSALPHGRILDGTTVVHSTVHTGGMDGDVVTPGGIVIPAAAMTWRFSRSTGPGGQGVNTTR